MLSHNDQQTSHAELSPGPEQTLSVIIPVFNEQSLVGTTLARIRQCGIPCQIVVVNDGSTDGTGEALRQETGITLIEHDRNRGKGASIRTALKHVTGDVIIIQDADLEYDPHEYAKVLDPLRAGKADVVYGTRFGGEGPHRVLFFWHMLGNRLLTFLSNMLTNLSLTDMETGLKAFTRTVAEQLTIKEDRFGFEPEFTARVGHMRVRIYEVGISYSGRTYSEGKKITWKDGFVAICCILRYNLFK